MLVMKPTPADVMRWFEEHYIQWRSRQTARQVGVTQWAKFLDVKRDTLNKYMLRGSLPEGENKLRIGDKYPELYDLLGEARPDPQFRSLARNWERIPARVRRQMMEQAEQYSAVSEEGVKRERSKKAG